MTSLKQPIESLRSVLHFRRLELNPVRRRLARAASIDDLRRIAKRTTPSGVFDYIDGAAEDERTLAANSTDFASLTFRPRVLRDVGEVDPSTTVLGRSLPLPLILSPTGFSRMPHPDGELAVARAAQRAGLPYCLSTMATRSIEDVASANADGQHWFQVYVWRDRGLVRELIQRASASGYEALVVTVDTAVLGKRERDVRRGFSMPPKLGLDTLVQGAIHPGWTWRFINSDPVRFANVIGRSGLGDGATAVTLADYVNTQFDPRLSWADVEWMRSVWNGPIVIKGIQTVADAQIAVDHGLDAIALSNHGGRQLDDAPTPISLVPPVVDEVGGKIEIYCDGGIRRGSDIVKAVSLGANACMIGRAYLYGLAAGGEAGVNHALGLLDAEVRRTMALIGATNIASLDRQLVQPRTAGFLGTLERDQ